MRIRWVLLFTIYAVFYLLLHFAFLMPWLILHNVSLPHLITSPRHLMTFPDLLLSFFFCLLPYLCLYYFFPRTRVLSISLSLGLLPLILFLSYVVQNRIEAIRISTYFGEHLFYDLIYASIGMSFYFFRYSHFQDLQQKEAIIQGRQAELSFLRSQINPHFLFNSLNNIYTLVYEKSPQSLEALATLSDLLRYILYDTTERVPLAKELNYIEKYISLQCLRFDHQIPVNVKTMGEAGGVLLPPLLLIPFVENAFKHGDLSEGSHGIEINVWVSKNTVLFYCRNQKGHHQKDEEGGVGLQNVRRRLNLLYPGNYELTIQEEGSFFTTQLEINYA